MSGSHRRLVAQVGEQFGNRVIIAVEEHSDGWHHRVTTRCLECHHEQRLAYTYLKKTPHECRHKTNALTHPRYKVGDRFGGRIIEGFVRHNGKLMLQVRCDCGRRYTANLHHTVTRQPKFCRECVPHTRTYLGRPDLYSYPETPRQCMAHALKRQGLTNIAIAQQLKVSPGAVTRLLQGLAQ